MGALIDEKKFPNIRIENPNIKGDVCLLNIIPLDSLFDQDKRALISLLFMLFNT